MANYSQKLTELANEIPGAVNTYLCNENNILKVRFGHIAFPEDNFFLTYEPKTQLLKSYVELHLM